MAKTISVGELRQNPTAALNGVAAGESYDVTKHNQVIARLVPAIEAASAVAGLSISAPRRGATLDRAKNSPLYRRGRSDSLTKKMLDTVEEGRDRMGAIGQ